jgi:hypothetical protein
LLLDLTGDFDTSVHKSNGEVDLRILLAPGGWAGFDLHTNLVQHGTCVKAQRSHRKRLSNTTCQITYLGQAEVGGDTY